MNQYKLFYKTSTSTASSSASWTNLSVASSGSSSTNQSNHLLTNQSRVNTLMSSLSVTRNKIRWVMKMLMSHFSFRFCLDLNELLKTMFPDRQIAKSFGFWKRKCSCYLVFGLAPYLKETLMESIKSSPSYSVSFDESVNHHLQEEQMDVQVRYWDSETVQVITQYLDSRFFL